MKMKYYFLFAAILLITACSNHEKIDSTPTKTNMFVSGIRSYAEALKIAQDAIPMLNGGATTRREFNDRKIDLSKKEVIKLDAKTRVNNNINDTLIYVFNFENNEGFALVSASKNTEGLLAITEKGHCDPSTRSNVCGFEIILDLVKDYVANSKSRDLIDYKDSLISATYNYVGPYVTVQWGQDHAEGEFCPNGAAGCSNTAMAQIMSYYQHPSSINLNYPGRDKSSQSLNWTAMKAHGTEHYLSSCIDTTTHKSIGRLHRQLGEWNHSVYNSNGSTSTSTMTFAPATFGNLGYSYNFGITNALSIRSELNNAHLLLIRGETASQDAHAWVLDGNVKQDGVYYEMMNNGTGWIFTGEVHYKTLYYNHMNWGWYGTNNGYFIEDIFNTSQGSFWDTSSHYVNYNYGYYVWLLSVYH